MKKYTISKAQIQQIGITGIWKDRHDENAIIAIKEELKRAKGELLLAGVALPDFFKGMPAKFTPEIFALMQKPSVKLRILLLNPKGVHAKERGIIESARFTKIDIEETIKHLKQVTPRASVVVHTYNFPPMAFLIITNRCVFIEQYHYGSPRGDLGCTGGQTPFMRLDKTSVTYKIMKEHFEYIWAEKSKEIINKREPK